MIRRNLFFHRRGLYAWVALGLVLLASLLYVSQDPSLPRSGSTWQGYTLGGLSLIIMVWLATLGIRKRRYRASGTLQGWVSAHVYLGLALVGIVTLHSAGQLGWNVHAAAYIFLLVVVISGIAGTWMYIVLPHWATENRKGLAREEMLRELSDIDSECAEVSSHCSAATQLAIRSSLQGTRLGGTLWDQLLGIDKSTYSGSIDASNTEHTQILGNADQTRILQFLADLLPNAEDPQEANALSESISLVARRQELLRRIRKDIQIQSWLKFWLLVHVPMTFGLLGAIAVHITVVFIYW